MRAFRKPFGSLPEDPFATSPKHPLGRPSSKPPSKTLSEPPSFEDPPPFDSQPAASSRKPFSKTLFETCRSLFSKPFGERRVSQNPSGAVAKPCRVPHRSLRQNLLRNPSGHARCPEDQPGGHSSKPLSE